MYKSDAFLAALAILCITAVLLSPVACTANRHRVIADAIKAGADPMATKCAVEGDIGNVQMQQCLSHVTRQPEASAK
jgi:hypothetical protein